MKRFALFVTALLCASPALAQATYPTPAGSRVNGVVPLICDATGANCVPSGSTGSGSGTTGDPTAVQGSVANGAAPTTNPVLVAGTDGSNVRTIRTDAGGRIIVDAPYSNGGAIVSTGLGVVIRDTVASVSRNLVGEAGGLYVIKAPSSAAAAAITTVASSAVTTGQVIKASAGNLYGFNVVSGASAGYVMVFNSTTVPADGAVTPARCLPLAANTGLDINLRGQPVHFSTGITIVFSTTGCFTKTASATAFIAGDAQ